MTFVLLARSTENGERRTEIACIASCYIISQSVRSIVALSQRPRDTCVSTTQRATRTDSLGPSNADLACMPHSPRSQLRATPRRAEPSRASPGRRSPAGGMCRLQTLRSTYHDGPDKLAAPPDARHGEVPFLRSGVGGCRITLCGVPRNSELGLELKLKLELRVSRVSVHVLRVCGSDRAESKRAGASVACDKMQETRKRGAAVCD
jgi:hypothetical protein